MNINKKINNNACCAIRRVKMATLWYIWDSWKNKVHYLHHFMVIKIKATYFLLLASMLYIPNATLTSIRGKWNFHVHFVVKKLIWFFHAENIKICENVLNAVYIVKFKELSFNSLQELLFKHLIESYGLNSLIYLPRYQQ